jgi:hypothetical protein
VVALASTSAQNVRIVPFRLVYIAPVTPAGFPARHGSR